MKIELSKTEIVKILEYLINPESLSNGKALDLIEKLENELEKNKTDNTFNNTKSS